MLVFFCYKIKYTFFKNTQFLFSSSVFLFCLLNFFLQKHNENKNSNNKPSLFLYLKWDLQLVEWAIMHLQVLLPHLLLLLIMLMNLSLLVMALLLPKLVIMQLQQLPPVPNPSRSLAMILSKTQLALSTHPLVVPVVEESKNQKIPLFQKKLTRASKSFT